MAPAAVLSCEETRQTCAKTRARHQLHADVDVWLDTWEAHCPMPHPAWRSAQAVLAMRQELTGRSTEGLVEQRHAPVLQQRTLACPHGQRLLAARPAPPRTVPTMVGEVSLARPDCYCRPCQRVFSRGCSPPAFCAPHAMGQQKAGARWAAEVPCDTAQELCAALTGLSLSAHTVHEVAGELSHALGVLEVGPTAAEMAHRVAAIAAGKTWRPVVVLAIDGACVPTRPEPATGRWLAAGTRGPSGHRGQGHGRRPRAFAAPWWSGSGSCIC